MNNVKSNSNTQVMRWVNPITTVDAANLPAENEKLLNALYLTNQLWWSVEPSSGLLDSIRSVADQCPYEGGFAVHWARGLYSRFVSTTSWNDTTLCAVSERAARSEQNRAHGGALLLTPNPAGDLLQINTTGFNSEVLLQLVNASGSVVLQTTHPAGTHTGQLSVAHLPNGLYFYRSVEQGQITHTGKLVIQH
ncbi:MAG: T9SS type A sorting domain-containing protein [Saprospiraceae bacterium]|nr:T9SS type A sorting domain-containing protein [Saprospiraceae bacterium]